MGSEPHGGEPGGPQNSQIEENRVRQRAHEIWIEEGKPEGRALSHWLRAKWELEARDLGAQVARLEQDARERNKQK